MTIHEEMENISEMAQDLKEDMKMEMKSREELEAEFSAKYANGDFDDQMILDDSLPDFKDNWISEQS